MSDMKFDAERMKHDIQESMDALNGAKGDAGDYPPTSQGTSIGDEPQYPPTSEGTSTGDERQYPPTSEGTAIGDEKDDYPDVDESYPVVP